MGCTTYVHFEQVGIGMKLLCLLFIFVSLIRYDCKFAIFIVKHWLFFGGEAKIETFFKITYF